MMVLSVGNFVTFPSAPGIGRVAETDGSKVRIEFFESAAEPVADAGWCDIADVRRVLLGQQTRVYFKDGNGRWRAGRHRIDDCPGGACNGL